ncbi:MAG: hypothetical protein PHH85_13785 [Candidatus Methanoperedens sp.]|nr:hypothetical protein [Candidatus Methanoperedens sp.]
MVLDKVESAGGKTKVCPPDMAVRIAWALTLELSSSKAPQEAGNRATLLMENIRKNAEGSSQKEAEILYINWVFSSIEATYRNLATITNGRNLNYDQIKAIRDKEIENIQYYSQFTLNLQSAVPRILGMTLGGVGGVVILSKLILTYFPQNNFEYAPQLSIAAGAVIGYIANGFIVIPWIRKRMLIKVIKLDNDTNLYYKHYLERSKKSLITLYSTVEQIHMNIFKCFYDTNKTDEDIKAIVEKMLSGINPTMCKNVGECMRYNDITPDCWSVCETFHEDKNCCNEKKGWLSKKYRFIKEFVHKIL